MENVTLLVGVIGSILAVVLRPAYALAVYVVVLVWYPTYLTISVDTADLSAGRIVVVVLLLRCLIDGRIRGKFTWSRLDKWVTVSIVVYVVMYFLTRPFSLALENRSGFLMGTWFTYMAARFSITDKEALVRFVKGAGVALAALAVLGVVECVTHRYFFLHLERFRKWDTPMEDPTNIPLKWGLLSRAVGPFSHAIMFGTCFTMFLPLVWTLRRERDLWRQLAYLLSAALVLGALSSMSSNAWMSTIFVILILSLERRSRWAKPLVKGVVIVSVLVEVLSNRHFYHVLLQYANPASGTWWARAKLIDCAVETFGEWWLVGYKGLDPGWGPKMGMGHTDVNNEFILAGVNYGILGVLALVIVLAVAIRQLTKFYRSTRDPVLQSWAWALGGMLVALIITFQGVSLFGQNGALFYCLLGVIGSVAVFREASRPVVVKARRSTAVWSHHGLSLSRKSPM